MPDQNSQNMPENNDEKKEKELAIANYYTKGDEEKAKLMANQNYKDLYVFKVKFSSPDMNGAILIFFNYFFKTLTDSYCILSSSFDILNFNVELEWLKYEEMISEFLDRGEHEQGLMFKMFEKIKEGFNPQVGEEIVTLISQNNHDDLRMKFSSDILNKLGYENLKVELSYETISSLDMELNSKSSRKLNDDEIHGEKEKDGIEQEDDLEIVPIEDNEDVENFKDKDIKLILDGSLILSPIKGMNITGLVVGDKIRIRMDGDNARTVQIAKAFNAYKNGRMGPIIGEIVSYRKKTDGGYKIFVEIADGVFVRINEDEENIKVDFVQSSKDRPEHLQKGIEKYVDKHVESEKKKSESAESKQEKKKYIQFDFSLFLFFILIIVSILTVFAIALLI